MRSPLKRSSAFLALFFFFFPSVVAFANTTQIKAYKEAFPDEKPKCIGCHDVEKPKKDGDHGWNEYGKKVKALAEAAKKEAPDADTYKQAGQIA